MRIREDGTVVDLMKLTERIGFSVGLQEYVTITVNGLVSKHKDEVLMRMEGNCNRVIIGVTGPEGEYRAIIGYKDRYHTSDNSRYGDQGVGMDRNKHTSDNSRYGDQGIGMDRNKGLYNKGSSDDSMYCWAAIRTGDLIKMVVHNHTLTYYHNNKKLMFRDNPIRLLKDRDYKFGVTLYGTSSVRIIR